MRFSSMKALRTFAQTDTNHKVHKRCKKKLPMIQVSQIIHSASARTRIVDQTTQLDDDASEEFVSYPKQGQETANIRHLQETEDIGTRLFHKCQ